MIGGQGVGQGDICHSQTRSFFKGALEVFILRRLAAQCRHTPTHANRTLRISADEITDSFAHLRRRDTQAAAPAPEHR